MRLGELAHQRELEFLQELDAKGEIILCDDEITDMHRDLEEYGYIETTSGGRFDVWSLDTYIITEKGRKAISEG